MGKALKSFALITIMVALVAIVGIACSGDEGTQGPEGAQGDQGIQGTQGDVGTAGTDGTDGTAGTDGIDGVDGADYITAIAEPESCVICHKEAGVELHQSDYDMYTDASKLAITIDSVATDAEGTGDAVGTWNTTVTLSITKDGLPFTDVANLGVNRLYAVNYDGTSATPFTDDYRFRGAPLL